MIYSELFASEPRFPMAGNDQSSNQKVQLREELIDVDELWSLQKGKKENEPVSLFDFSSAADGLKRGPAYFAKTPVFLPGPDERYSELDYLVNDCKDNFKQLIEKANSSRVYNEEQNNQRLLVQGPEVRIIKGEEAIRYLKEKGISRPSEKVINQRSYTPILTKSSYFSPEYRY